VFGFIIKKFIPIKSSNFSGGGLILNRPLATAKNSFTSPSNFIAPIKLDFRDMCIKTSNQLSTPHCAGFSTAGMIEVKNWKEKHYPEQLDGDAIYKEAKKIEGNDNPGTSLEYTGTAAINLKLIKGNLQFVKKSIDSIKFCIHTHTTFVAGFMITDEWNRVDKKGRIGDIEFPAQLGGHAVLVCGYDSIGVYIQNSWGSGWGIHGFAIIPWNKVTQQFIYGMVIS